MLTIFDLDDVQTDKLLGLGGDANKPLGLDDNAPPLSRDDNTPKPLCLDENAPATPLGLDDDAPKPLCLNDVVQQWY